MQKLRSFLRMYRVSQSADKQSCHRGGLDTSATTNESVHLESEIIYIGKCQDEGETRTIWVCMKYPNGNHEWESHPLDLVKGRPDFQSAV
jgi:hypothetical protein